jgi:hypothetical protein
MFGEVLYALRSFTQRVIAVKGIRQIFSALRNHCFAGSGLPQALLGAGGLRGGVASRKRSLPPRRRTASPDAFSGRTADR